MNRRVLQAAGAAALSRAVKSPFPKETLADPRPSVRIAEALKPGLIRTADAAVAIVHPIRQSGPFLRWKMEPVAPGAALEGQAHYGADVENRASGADTLHNDSAER